MYSSLSKEKLYDKISGCYKGKIVDNNYFYYTFEFNELRFKKILLDGIKSRHLLEPIDYNFCFNNPNFNGKYYVSASKIMTRNTLDRNFSYNVYDYLPAFIIKNDIKALHLNSKLYQKNLKYRDTVLPFRPTIYKDEYQIFNKIKASKIIGIRYNFKDILKANCLHFQDFNPDVCNYHLVDLDNLFSMISVLKSLSIDLPIYDLSINKEIDKEKVLSLKF